MTFKHNSKQIAKTLRIRRLAGRVKKQLIDCGINCQYMAYVDWYGAQLTYTSLRVGNLEVLVRPLGHVLSFLELDYLASVPRGYVQYGATDIAGLLACVGTYAAVDAAPHWAAGKA